MLELDDSYREDVDDPQLLRIFNSETETEPDGGDKYAEYAVSKASKC